MDELTGIVYLQMLLKEGTDGLNTVGLLVQFRDDYNDIFITRIGLTIVLLSLVQFDLVWFGLA